MKKRTALFFTLIVYFITACGTMQSIVKSSLPYTTTLTIPVTAGIGQNLSAIGTATSIDKTFFKNSNYINAVKIVTAELRSSTPADFDLSNIKSVKIYIAKNDDSNTILVASKDNIALDAGNTLALDVDNSNFLDRFIRDPDIKIKMTYQLRKQVAAETQLMLVLNIGGVPVVGK